LFNDKICGLYVCNMDDIKLEYATDDNGNDILRTTDKKHQVMMEWERDYMCACIKQMDIKPGMDVLEIGFGLGYSASAIQEKLKGEGTHTILECNPVVLKQLNKWAKNKEYSKIIPVFGRWQAVLKNLGKFDRIFFDDYPFESEEYTKNYDPIQLSLSLGRFELFVSLCGQDHMRKGGVMGAYAYVPFRPGDSTLRLFGLRLEQYLYKLDKGTIPSHCKYVCKNQGDQMYIPIITKL
jgi:hypothetical protein